MKIILFLSLCLAANIASAQSIVKQNMTISDPSIIVQRTKLRDFSKKQFLGNKRTDERTFVSKIRNTKKTPINIVIQDQIPVSTNKELTIENVEAKNAQIDPATGKVEWRIDVPPTSEKILNLHYEAKYLRSERVFLE